MNPKANREKLVQIMFEKYGFQAVYVAIQAVLTLYAQGWPKKLARTCVLSLLTRTPASRRSLDGCRRRQWRWRHAHCARLYVFVNPKTKNSPDLKTQIDEGYSLPHLTRRLDVAGRAVTRYLIKLMLLVSLVFVFVSSSSLRARLPDADTSLARLLTARLRVQSHGRL